MFPRGSVSHPFVGDYVKLRDNSKWKKMSADTDDQHLVFADIVMKVNRRDGKVGSRSYDIGILNELLSVLLYLFLLLLYKMKR